LAYTPHHKIEKRKEKKKKEASCKSEPQNKLWCEFLSLKDKHLTYFLQIMTWMDSQRCQNVFLCAHRKMNLEGGDCIENYIILSKWEFSSKFQ
jgi:hypothetical protein